MAHQQSESRSREKNHDRPRQRAAKPPIGYALGRGRFSPLERDSSFADVAQTALGIALEAALEQAA